MLDLLKVSVVLTVQTALRRAASSLSEGLPAPLVFEWNDSASFSFYRGLSRSIDIYRGDAFQFDGKSDGKNLTRTLSVFFTAGKCCASGIPISVQSGSPRLNPARKRR
jgi:hypothetical protein